MTLADWQARKVGQNLNIPYRAYLTLWFDMGRSSKQVTNYQGLTRHESRLELVAGMPRGSSMNRSQIESVPLLVHYLPRLKGECRVLLLLLKVPPGPGH